MDYVPKYYEMDPETDLFCPTGFQLRRGWVVLIEGYELKEEPKDIARWSSQQIERANRWNRWGTVVETRLGTDGQLNVIMRYDNILKQLSCNPNLAWLVKEDSVNFPEVSAEDGIIVNGE